MSRHCYNVPVVFYRPCTHQLSRYFFAVAVEFLPSEKQGMARVVCDELARQAYDSPTEVFVKRLIQLRELSEDWEQIDGMKNSNSSSSATAAAAGAAGISPAKKERAVNSDNDASDNDDNGECDVSMVCDEIPSTSDYVAQERRPRSVHRKSYRFSLSVVLCEYSKFRMESNSYFIIRFEASTII